MNILSVLTRKAYSFSSYIEDPILFQVWRRGGVVNLYKELNNSWFRDLNISTVLDIGANVGQSTITLNKLLPDAEIYAFEPIPECFASLNNKFENQSNVHPINLGIGDESGEITFEKNDYSQSSSFLKMSNIHKESFPFTSKTELITVKIEKLDEVVKEFHLQGEIMAKIDTQGYEDKVIVGGVDTLSRCKLIIIETSFYELYEKQPLFSSIYEQLTDIGFEYKGTLDSVFCPATRRVLQADSIFIQND
jgi:FkbM family methyltransferase